MIAPLKLRSGEIPLLPLSAVARLAITAGVIDCSDRPAVRALVNFAALGMAVEIVQKAEQRVPLAQRSVPPALAWRPLLECDRDIYAYGTGVCEAFESLHPPAAKVEAALGNSEPAVVGSPASAGSPGPTLAETPSPS